MSQNYMYGNLMEIKVKNQGKVVKMTATSEAEKK